MNLKTDHGIKNVWCLIGLCCLLLLPTLQGCSRPNKVGTPPAVTPDPTIMDEPGAFEISRFNLQMRNDRGTYSGTLYHPSSAGSYPAIAFSPGLGAQKEYYRWVGNHLSSHGYIVLIFTVPVPLTTGTSQHEAGFVSAFEWLESANSNPESPIHGQVDLAHRGIMGHSLGGAAVTRAAPNMNIEAAVALAPGAPGDTTQTQTATQPVNLRPQLMTTLASITVPIQIQASTQDCITGEYWDAAYYNALTAPARQFVLINGSNHVSFNDADSIAYIAGKNLDCKEVVDTVNHAQRLSRRYFTAWFDYFLKNDSSAEPYLFGGVAEQDLASELLKTLEYAMP